jgi:hypothetical protein
MSAALVIGFTAISSFGPLGAGPETGLADGGEGDPPGQPELSLR